MVKINFANPNNIELISGLEKDNFFGEAYSFDTLNEMLKDNYIMKNNDNIFTISDEDDLIGYIIFHISDDFTDIYKIFIRDKDKKKGLGTMLLNYVENLAKRYKSKKMMIEVRANNKPAINFYNKFGFKMVDNRKNYYKNPIDDALIFEKVMEQ